MNKEININLDTIIKLIDKLIDNKTLYLNTKDIDFNCLDNKYTFMNNFIKEISGYNYISISYDSDKPSYKKALEQYALILRDILMKYNKVKNIIESSTYRKNDNISLVEMIDILLNLKIDKQYMDILYEKIENSHFTIRDYGWIKSFIENIRDTNLIKSYLKYKKFNNSYKFNDLKNNISCDDITNALYKLECLLNNEYALIPPIYENDFTKYFINANFSLSISENELINYISNLKIDYNCEPKKLKWYHYLNRKKCTEVKLYNKAITDEYNNIKKTMCNQYKENIESLNLYVNSFDFLKDFLNESYFNKIYNYIYDENEMYIFLKNIFNTLSLYKEIISIQNQIYTLNDKERELLDLCYDKNDTISKYTEKLFTLPSILILLNFKMIEEDSAEITIKRDLLDTLIIQLNNDLDILSKLINKNNYISILKINTFEYISEIEESSSITNYILKTLEYDDSIRYIDEFFTNNLTFNKKHDTTSNMLKFLREKIEGLGYRVVEDYTFNSINLEFVVFHPSNPNRIIYIFMDSLVSKTYDIIKKLSYIKQLNIPIIYCWADEFFINQNIETVNLKEKLKYLL